MLRSDDNLANSWQRQSFLNYLVSTGFINYVYYKYWAKLMSIKVLYRLKCQRSICQTTPNLKVDPARTVVLKWKNCAFLVRQLWSSDDLGMFRRGGTKPQLHVPCLSHLTGEARAWIFVREEHVLSLAAIANPFMMYELH